MSLATRFLVHLVRRSSAGAGASAAQLTRHHCFSTGPGSVRGSKRDGDDSAAGSPPTQILVTETKGGGGNVDAGAVKLDLCGDIEEEDEEDVEEMLQDGPAGREWGGPTRGGVLSEPTRFGDWERKGRCSDF